MVCVGLCWARVGTILGLSWAILDYVGTFWATLAPYWAMLSQELGPYWAYLGPFWAMLGHFRQHRHRVGLMLNHFSWFVGPYFGPCWDILGHVGTIFG